MFKKRGKYMKCLLTFILCFFFHFSLGAAICPSGADLSAGLEGYLTAMQNHRFAEAFEFVSSNMTDGKSVDEWATLQEYLYVGGEVTIFGISVRDAKAFDDDLECRTKAIVPNVLRSRDKFNNQGTTEFELYTVIRNNDGWKVDSVEVLFEEDEIRQWFPNDHIPIFRNQHPNQ